MLFRSDIEADAIMASDHNAGLNGVAERFVASRQWPRLPYGADVVAANLLAPTLRDLASPITEHCAPESVIVASGLLIGQWETVADWYPNLTVVDRHQLDAWESVVLAPSGEV